MIFDNVRSYFDKKPASPKLDASTSSQLQEHFEKLRSTVELRASLDDSPQAQELKAFLVEIAALSDKLVVHDDGTDARRPSFAISGPKDPARIRFAGIPLGHELSSLVLAILHTGGHPPKIDAPIIERIRALHGPLHFETYVTLSCHNCPDVVQTFNMMAVLNPDISHTMIDGHMFRKEIDQHKIDAVPTLFLNGSPFDRGRKTIEEFVARIGELSGH